MNKKIISLAVLLLTVCNICTICFATETGTVYLESNYNTIEVGDEVEITINLKDSWAAAFNLFLYYDNTKWEYISKIDNTNVEDNRILFVWYDLTGRKQSKTRRTYKI